MSGGAYGSLWSEFCAGAEVTAHGLGYSLFAI